MREGRENDDKGMVSDNEGVQSLGGREMLSSIRDGICVCVAVVVVALMVAMEVMVIVVRVSCIGVVGVLCIGVVEVDCAGVVDILVLDEVFLVEVVEGVELVVREVVRCVVRLVLWCVNGKGYFFGLLWPEIGGNEWTVWEWVSLWDGDLSGLFCPFGTWFLGQDVRCRCVDGHGG